MAKPFEKSVRYIKEFIKSLAPDAKVQQVPEFTFRLDLHDDRMEVRFDRSEMEDFEVALDRFKNTKLAVRSCVSPVDGRVPLRCWVSRRDAILPTGSRPLAAQDLPLVWPFARRHSELSGRI